MGKILKESLIRMSLVCIREEEVMQKNIETMEERDKEGFEKTKAKIGCLK